MVENHEEKGADRWLGGLYEQFVTG